MCAQKVACCCIVIGRYGYKSSFGANKEVVIAGVDKKQPPQNCEDTDAIIEWLRISRVWNWFSSGKVTLHFLATKKLPFWKENIEQTRKALRFLPIWRKKMHSFLDLLGDTFQLASFVWCTLLLWANVFDRHLNDQLSKISNFWWKYEFFAFNPWFCNCDQTCVKIEVSWCLLQPFWFKSVLCTGGRYRLCLGLVREYKNSICS